MRKQINQYLHLCDAKSLGKETASTAPEASLRRAAFTTWSRAIDTIGAVVTRGAGAAEDVICVVGAHLVLRACQTNLKEKYVSKYLTEVANKQGQKLSIRT